MHNHKSSHFEWIIASEGAEMIKKLRITNNINHIKKIQCVGKVKFLCKMPQFNLIFIFLAGRQDILRFANINNSFNK